MRNWELPQMSRIIPFIFYSCEEIKNVLWIPVTVLLSYHPLFCQRLLACRVISDHFFIVLSLRLQKRFSFFSFFLFPFWTIDRDILRSRSAGFRSQMINLEAQSPPNQARPKQKTFFFFFF